MVCCAKHTLHKIPHGAGLHPQHGVHPPLFLSLTSKVIIVSFCLLPLDLICFSFSSYSRWKLRSLVGIVVEIVLSDLLQIFCFFLFVLAVLSPLLFIWNLGSACQFLPKTDLLVFFIGTTLNLCINLGRIHILAILNFSAHKQPSDFCLPFLSVIL